MEQKVTGVIPCRYNSTRFPGKPLALINGIPMVVMVYNNAKKASLLHELYVATDDDRIYQKCLEFNVNVVKTKQCETGSDRVNEVLKQTKGDIYVNIQGDEPLISSLLIDNLIKAFSEDKSVDVVTAKKLITNSEELESENVVKVVTDINNRALYFSRFSIPFKRRVCKIKHYKHIGIYAYKRKALEIFSSLEKSELEESESLEQLRFLENGFKIFVIETEYDSIGVDEPEDIEKVLKILNKK